MDIEDPSGWAAGAVAVLAVLIALAAWWAAHRSAMASERSADASERSATASERSAAASEELLHQQRTPRFTAEIEEVSQWHRLAIRLDGPLDLDDLSVESLNDEFVFNTDQFGIDKEPIPAGHEAVGGRPGRRVAWTNSGYPDGARAGIKIGETA
ncbi:hypothetical protein ACIA59_23975 [Micromonospora haikouensis]|uniref:hypothetical protein n=1 Tax=Micromonospora haikouensis TaxID=686309 RepID=UPI0037AE46F1